MFIPGIVRWSRTCTLRWSGHWFTILEDFGGLSQGYDFQPSLYLLNELENLALHGQRSHPMIRAIRPTMRCFSNKRHVFICLKLSSLVVDLVGGSADRGRSGRVADFAGWAYLDWVVSKKNVPPATLYMINAAYISCHHPTLEPNKNIARYMQRYRSVNWNIQICELDKWEDAEFVHGPLFLD